MIDMIISLFNQKGGCGKSTTASNLAAYLSRHGKRVLAVDMDPQANLTVSLGINDEDLDKTVYDLLRTSEFKKERIQEVIIKTAYDRLDLLPSDITLSDAEITLSTALTRETILKKILEQLKDVYDYIIIDCPPSLGLLSVNALSASDYIIVPVTPQFFSIKGIKHLLNTFKLVKEKINPQLEILGVLITKYDARKKIAKDIRSMLVEHFQDKVFNTIIREDVKIEYSQDELTPIVYYYEKCKGYEDYINLGKEVLEICQKVQKEF